MTTTEHPDTADTWQQLMRLPFGDPILEEPKRSLLRRWCVENSGCRGSAEALAHLIGPTDLCEVFDRIEALTAEVERLRTHVPEIDPDKRTTPLGCAAHDEWVRWPCPEIERAEQTAGEVNDEHS